MQNELIEVQERVEDSLIYRSYVFQRERFPNVKPERWRSLYFSQEIFEQYYQKEKK